MKKIILIVCSLLFLNQLKSQNNFNCSSHLNYVEELKTNPQFKINQELLELETKNFIANSNLNKTTSATYIIPVVFHVIHSGSAGNISSAQILDQIAILNKEFQRQQPDTVLTPAAFRPLAAPFSVEFRLATIDPSGNCTDGIDRIYSTTSVCSVNQDAIKTLSYWPSNKYLNIWLVETMHYSSSTTCNGGGYATFPGGTPALDGINIRGDLIGSIGTSATNPIWGNFFGRYLIHELGHWFNLRHIWGDTQCGDDLVADTPIAEDYNSGCPTFPYKPFNTCGGDGNGEMYTNYMDYTDGGCLNMFSIGQVARMTAAINSSVSGRNNLWSASNLTLTGTSDPYTYPPNCVSTPEVFPYSSILACAGDSVKFSDISYGNQQTSRLWNFYGEPASSLTDSVVKVKYNTPGIYNVELTANNGLNTKTKQFLNKVYVIDNNYNTNYTSPYNDSLESVTKFNNNWVVVNKDNNAYKWQSMATTNFSGLRCIGINNFSNIAPSVDELISPAYNLTGAPTATLNFKLHYAAKTATSYDKLVIYTSTNCGQTWALKYIKNGTTSLKTVATYYTSSHTPPSGSSEWRQESINLTNNWGVNPVRFKFTFTSGGGNNIFIDDININTQLTTNVKTWNEKSGISIFPNPSENELNLAFESKINNPFEIEFIDVLGKLIFTQHFNQITDQKLKIDTKQLSEGVYFINIKTNNAVIYTDKFIKQYSK